MFNKNILTTAICATALLGGTYSSTSVAATAPGNATAVIINPLSIVETTPMLMGSIVPSATVLSTIQVDSTGAVSTTVGDATTSGAANAGTFTATGQISTLISSITFLPGAVSDGNPLTVMPITPYEHDAGATPTTDGFGDLVFNVGVTIDVPVGQAAGTYNTTNANGVPYSVIVNY